MCHGWSSRRDQEFFARLVRDLFELRDTASGHNKMARVLTPKCATVSVTPSSWRTTDANTASTNATPRRKRLSDGGFKSGDDCFRCGEGQRLIREIADEFDVSQTATLFRLQSSASCRGNIKPR
jgi:hypothetical protein